MCKGSSDEYKVDRHDKGSREVEVQKPVNTNFPAATNFEAYGPTVQLQKYNGLD